jgi:hypothetical protein
MQLGTSFSIKQCEYLGFSLDETKEVFAKVCQMGFDWIRLASYWDLIEPSSGEFDFSSLDWQLAEVAKHPDLKVVLNVGMKQFRWPEFHFPKWVEEKYPNQIQISQHPLDQDSNGNQHELAEKAQQFIEKVVRYTKAHQNIAAYQIENEALKGEHIAGNRYLSVAYLSGTADLVRDIKKAHQLIVMSNAIDLFPPVGSGDTKLFQKSTELTDIVGVNVYVRVPALGRYLEPTFLYWNKLNGWNPDWVLEAQWEPWEDGAAVHLDTEHKPSMNSERGVKLVEKLKSLGIETVFIWGVEHAFAHQKKYGGEYWLKPMTNLLTVND